MSDSTPVGVTCSGCGKTYRWRQDFAGQKVRCRACNGVLLMPLEPPGANESDSPDQTIPLAVSADPYEIDQGADHNDAIALGGDAEAPDISKCPSCGSPIGTTAAICVSCGFNILEGKQLETTVEADDTEPEKKKKRKKAPRDEEKQAEQPATHKSLKQRLADRDDELEPSKFIDIQLPLILIGIGVLAIFVNLLLLADWDTSGGGPGTGAATQAIAIGVVLVLMAVFIVITVGLMLMGLYAAAWILGVDFGPLHIGRLKLTGIALGVGALSDIVTALLAPVMVGSGFVGWFVALNAYWILISKLFDLDASDALWTVLIIAVVRFIGGIVFALLAIMIIASMMA